MGKCSHKVIHSIGGNAHAYVCACCGIKLYPIKFRVRVK